MYSCLLATQLGQQQQKNKRHAVQEPKVRPSAKYLLQHKFVVAPRPALAAAALLPLIARSRDALQAMAAASDPPVAPPSSRSGDCMIGRSQQLLVCSSSCYAINESTQTACRGLGQGLEHASGV